MTLLKTLLQLIFGFVGLRSDKLRDIFGRWDTRQVAIKNDFRYTLRGIKFGF
jgi:hypothetical protein